MIVFYILLTDRQGPIAKNIQDVFQPWSDILTGQTCVSPVLFLVGMICFCFRPVLMQLLLVFLICAYGSHE